MRFVATFRNAIRAALQAPIQPWRSSLRTSRALTGATGPEPLTRAQPRPSRVPPVARPAARLESSPAPDLMDALPDI